MSIKAEVVFDKDSVLLDEYEIVIDVDSCYMNKGEQYIDSFDYLEHAIKYCLEKVK